MGKKLFWKKFLWSTLGNLLLAIGTSMMKLAAFGNDCTASFEYALGSLFGLTGIPWMVEYRFLLGNIAMNVVLFIPMIIWKRKEIGWATIMNVGLLPFVVSWCDLLWPALGLSTTMALWARILFLLVGTPVSYFGIALFVQAQFGVGPYDAINLLLGDKISYRFAKMICDSTCVILALLIMSFVDRDQYTDFPSYAKVMFLGEDTVVSWFTVVGAIIAGPIVSAFGKLIDKTIFKDLPSNMTFKPGEKKEALEGNSLTQSENETDRAEDKPEGR